jgi:hypothetical protein
MHHHGPKRRVLIYVTPKLRSSAVMDDVPFEHLYWDDISNLVRRIWSDAPMTNANSRTSWSSS